MSTSDWTDALHDACIPEGSHIRVWDLTLDPPDVRYEYQIVHPGSVAGTVYQIHENESVPAPGRFLTVWTADPGDLEPGDRVTITRRPE